MSGWGDLNSAIGNAKDDPLSAWVTGGVSSVPGVGNLNPFTVGQKDEGKAAGNIEEAKSEFKGLKTPDLTPVEQQRAGTHLATTSEVGPTALAGIKTDPSNMAAQRAQLAALSQLAANGGHNAASDANLARIQQQENANAAGQRGAIQNSFAARGMGGSGADMLAQLTASQNATNNQSAQDLAVRGQDAQTALQAGQGAAGIGAGLEGQEYGEQANAAAAADKIAAFNAGSKNQASQYNAGQGNQVDEFNASQGNQIAEYNANQPQTEYEDAYKKAAGSAGADMGAVGYFGNVAGQKSQMAGNILGSAIGGAAKVAASAGGGAIPGRAAVAGNSYANDAPGVGVNVVTSPGEVIVPRTIAMHGSKSQIGSFVKNPPMISDPDSRKKEAMLSALKNLHRRR